MVFAIDSYNAKFTNTVMFVMFIATSFWKETRASPRRQKIKKPSEEEQSTKQVFFFSSKPSVQYHYIILIMCGQEEIDVCSLALY